MPTVMHAIPKLAHNSQYDGVIASAYKVAGAMAIAGALWWDKPDLAVVAIIILGVPHGALDGAIGRSLLAQPFGRAWFGVFGIPYLLMIGSILWLWQLTPTGMLNLFLGVSIFHFGTEMLPNRRDFAGIMAHGAAPVVLPVLIAPCQTEALLRLIANDQSLLTPPWIIAIFPVWMVCTFVELARAGRPGRLLCATIAIFIFLPPLEAFTAYFIFAHAPAHIHAIMCGPKKTTLNSYGKIIQAALPLSLGALAIGAIIWPFYHGVENTRLVTVTFQMLAALTVPHVIFNEWATWRQQHFRAEATS